LRRKALLGIHEIQAPFAAQFGPAAQGGIHKQMIGDVNDATKSHADHLRKMEEIKAREKIAQIQAGAKSQPQQEPEPDRIEDIIARLSMAQSMGLPFGGAK
jgi:Cdc6-like AAA superfamily ATPase